MYNKTTTNLKLGLSVTHHDGGVVIEAIHELPWNKYCATVIDKYGVCWWIAI